jgi:hypothetical protein
MLNVLVIPLLLLVVTASALGFRTALHRRRRSQSAEEPEEESGTLDSPGDGGSRDQTG